MSMKQNAPRPRHFPKDTFVVITLAVVAIIVVFIVFRIVEQVNLRAQVLNSANSSLLYGWGNDDSGQIGSGHLTIGAISQTAQSVQTRASVIAVYGGLRHSLALTDKGTVVAWGNNAYGQMGNGKKGGKQVTPTKVEGLPKITMLATKQDHNLALDETGHVWAWGLNMSGEIGNGNNDNQLKPVMVKGLDDVVSIATGYRTSLAVKKDGSVWTWGGYCNLESRADKSLVDYVTELSLGGYADTSGGTIDQITPEDDCMQEKYLNVFSYAPKRVEGLPAIQKVAAGFGHVLALTKDGDVWSWGCNLFGQVGNGVDHNTDANLTPSKIASLHDISDISAGFRHSLALGKDGQLWGWGHNYFGELGNGKSADETLYTTPMKLAVADNSVEHIYAGHDYSLAVKKDGELWGWGQASFGQLGKMEEYKVNPGAILNLKQVKAVAPGGAHAVVMTNQALEKN